MSKGMEPIPEEMLDLFQEAHEIAAQAIMDILALAEQQDLNKDKILGPVVGNAFCRALMGFAFSFKGHEMLYMQTTIDCIETLMEYMHKKHGLEYPE